MATVGFDVSNEFARAANENSHTIYMMTQERRLREKEAKKVRVVGHRDKRRAIVCYWCHRVYRTYQCTSESCL